MRVQEQMMVCACGHSFEADVLIEVELSVFLFALKKTRCPQCGADYKKLSFKTKPDGDE